ncbi:MAG: metal-dependent transcriptional regulator [Bacilli bacterium]|nr:metal-dependent transcriptional regulator [Bacilli bacterium]
MNVYESAEDYLERILILSKSMEFVRAIDIVNDMGFSKPSVSIAMRKLKQAGYIKYIKKNHIILTKSGLEIAENIYERHQILTQVLENLGVPSEIAKKDACKIEHDLSPETFEALKKHYKNNLD